MPLMNTSRRAHFQFEDLDIWHSAKDLAVELHKLAIVLERQHLYKYAEQLRSAALSVPNHIAEGSGSLHMKEFRQFLNIARRSLFENASMLLVMEAMLLWEPGTADHILNACDELSRMISSFSRSIRS